MPTKLTITLEQDKHHRNSRAMAKVIAMLTELETTPPQKLAVTIACEDEDAADVKSDLQALFSRRPAGIKVTIKTASEEEVAIEELVTLTPMEEALGEPIEGLAERYSARAVVSSDREPR